MENDQSACAWSHHRDQARAFMTAKLRTPRALDPLAREIHAELQQKRIGVCAWRDYQAELWQLVEWSVSLAAHRRATLSLKEELARLRPHIERARLRLPLVHAQVLSAAKDERLPLHSISKRFAMSETLAQQHLSQALALLRTLALESVDSDPELVLVSRREILTAQDAAYWVVRGSYERSLPVEELVHWLRERALHVREFFTAWQWNDVLESS